MLLNHHFILLRKYRRKAWFKPKARFEEPKPKPIKPWMQPEMPERRMWYKPRGYGKKGFVFKPYVKKPYTVKKTTPRQLKMLKRKAFFNKTALPTFAVRDGFVIDLAYFNNNVWAYKKWQRREAWRLDLVKYFKQRGGQKVIDKKEKIPAFVKKKFREMKRQFDMKMLHHTRKKELLFSVWEGMMGYLIFRGRNSEKLREQIYHEVKKKMRSDIYYELLGAFEKVVPYVDSERRKIGRKKYIYKPRLAHPRRQRLLTMTWLFKLRKGKNQPRGIYLKMVHENVVNACENKGQALEAKDRFYDILLINKENSRRRRRKHMWRRWAYCRNFKV